jgi:hypothetical protein
VESARIPSVEHANPASPRLSQRFLLRQATGLFSRLAGLPIALRQHQTRLHRPHAIVRLAYARRYWTIRTLSDLLQLVTAIVLAPAVLLGLSAWFLWRNGTTVALQFNRPLHWQFLDHLRLYFSAGVLPPWYYIYELYHQPGTRHARGFLYRWESKAGVFALLKEQRPPASIVSDKLAFATHCEMHGIATVPVIAIARAGEFDWIQPDARMTDWFVKPVDGKGGKGIERWDRVCEKHFESAAGEIVTEEQLIRRLQERSLKTPCLVQPRVVNHPDLRAINNGALATIRALTCMNEEERPELVGAVFRMAIGNNRVVDNLHAGGIVAGIDIKSGMVGPATNLGDDVKLGWLDRHPDSGAKISGRSLPYWNDLGTFVERAHTAFADRVLIGWDIAATKDGLVVVEANGAPDLDIMQRPFRKGLIRGRMGELLAHNLMRFKVIPSEYVVRFGKTA